MRQGSVLLALCLVLTASLTQLHAEQVGDFGDFARFEFRGVQTYSAKDLTGALQFSGDLQFAAHTTAPLDKFLAQVESFFEQGYRNGGFAKPAIRAFVADAGDHVVVEVKEGPRYVQGNIIITGSNELPIDTMRKCLLDPKSIGVKRLVIYSAAEFAAKAEETNNRQNNAKHRDDNPPKWEPGKHVRFDNRLRDVWSAQLVSLCRDFGYLDPQIELDFKLNDDSKKANLVVEIAKPGRELKADRVDIRGLKRNTRQQLLDYLSVSEGMRLDVKAVAEIEELLYSSARFVRHEASLVRNDEEREVSLILDVTELPNAPLLNEDFSERQLTLLRVGRWLENWESNASFMKFHLDLKGVQLIDEASLDVIVSPSEGLTGSLRARLASHDLQYAMSVTKARVAIYNAERQRCYDHPPFPLAKLDVNLGLVHDNDSIKSRLKLDGQANSDLKLDVPLSLRLKAAPALFVHRAAQPDAKWTGLENGLTTVRWERSSITFDSRTGAIHKLEDRAEDAIAQLTFGLDKTSKPHEDFAVRYYGLRNEYRADYPYASFFGFLVGELLWNARVAEEDSDELIRRTDVLSNLLASRLKLALDLLSSNDPDDESEKFPSRDSVSIPMTTDYQVLLSVLGPGAAEKLFPRGSWPWVLLREAAFSAQGRGEYTLDEIRRLLKNPDVGPVGCLMLAKMMTMVGAKRLSHEFAAKGTDQLTLEGFRRDLKLFTFGDKSAPKLIAAVVDLLRSLSEEEVTAVSDLLNKPELTKQVRRMHLMLANDDRASNELLVDRLEGLWGLVLRGRLEEALRSHLLDDTRRDSPFQP